MTSLVVQSTTRNNSESLFGLLFGPHASSLFNTTPGALHLTGIRGLQANRNLAWALAPEPNLAFGRKSEPGMRPASDAASLG